MTEEILTPKQEMCSVTELNHIVRHLLQSNLNAMWIRGEVCNASPYGTTVYFGLKDENAQVSAIFFHGASIFKRYDLKQGSKIEAYGQVDLYEKGGGYQFKVTQVRPEGMGDLYLRFEEMKNRLRSEGLFDEDRKKEIPLLPECIGLITSMHGAAIKDFMQILNRRFPNMHVRIVNEPVQGKGAAVRIANAVEYMNEVHGCDVIVITRGGGSMEDLWEFNEEVLARAVAASIIPVISAVGHERDCTICDFVSDFRVPTPSAAAELVVHAKAEMLEKFLNYQRRLLKSQQIRLQDCRMRLQRAASCRFLQHPEDLIQRLTQRLDIASVALERGLSWRVQQTEQKLQNLSARILNTTTVVFSQYRERLQHSAAVLNALNPKKVLQRGYSILLDERNQAVRSSESVKPNENVRAVLAQGEIKLKVIQSGDKK
ncbi:MAG: exodeoxyribonuclease VII large subunit [Lentisphaeria bacterium]